LIDDSDGDTEATSIRFAAGVFAKHLAKPPRLLRKRLPKYSAPKRTVLSIRAGPCL
jgi:hypothetical protein